MSMDKASRCERAESEDCDEVLQICARRTGQGWVEVEEVIPEVHCRKYLVQNITRVYVLKAVCLILAFLTAAARD